MGDNVFFTLRRKFHKTRHEMLLRRNNTNSSTLKFVHENVIRDELLSLHSTGRQVMASASFEPRSGLRTVDGSASWLFTTQQWKWCQAKWHKAKFKEKKKNTIPNSNKPEITYLAQKVNIFWFSSGGQVHFCHIVTSCWSRIPSISAFLWKRNTSGHFIQTCTKKM